MINKNIQNYKIISQIAEGGMGTVFYGEHLTLNRPVAIKQLHSNFTNNPDFKDRFINEAKILAQLSHSNIITIYDLIEENANYFIVMEYIQGDTIDAVMEKFNSPFQVQRAIYIFKQILSAFDYAHKRGIIHRDIKPSNIMLEEGDKPKILDFGIAKLVSSNLHLTKAGTRMGSVFYMSPEQVLGYDVDYRSDIYSLGVVLYEMLTRSLPYSFQTDTEYAIMDNIMKTEIPNLSSFRADIDSNISLAIQRACSKDANTRFSSCQEFLEAIDNKKFNYSPPPIASQTYSQPVSNATVITPAAYPQQMRGGIYPKKKNYVPYILIALVLIIATVIFIVVQNRDSNVVVSNNNINNSTPTTNTTTQNNSDNKQKIENSNAASDLVRSFLSDLGNRDFQSAYDKQKNKAWGSYNNFSSTKSFGGITSTEIKEVTLNYDNGNTASVYAYYYSYDPSNKDGWYKQDFELQKFGSEWKIVKVKNIDFKQW